MRLGHFCLIDQCFLLLPNNDLLLCYVRERSKKIFVSFSEMKIFVAKLP